MRYLIIAFLAISCGSTPQRNPFDQNNYVLTTSDSFKGNVGTQLFTYKYDTLRKMRLEYFADGKLMARIFTYKGKMDGNQYMYEFDGKTIMVKDSISNGIRINSQKFYKPDSSVKFYK